MPKRKKLHGSTTRILTFIGQTEHRSITSIEWYCQHEPVDLEVEWLRCRVHFARLNNGVDEYEEVHIIGAMYVHKGDMGALPRARWVNETNIGVGPEGMSYRQSMLAALERRLTELKDAGPATAPIQQETIQ